jgi:Flp pilus assembly protein TadD
MLRQSPHQNRSARRFASIASSAILALGLSLGLCGCQTDGTSDITGSLGDKTETSRTTDPRRDLDTYRDRFRTNPNDPDAALQYGRALRATGQRSQALAVLEQVSVAHPGNKALLAGYGRALADNGNFQQAFDVLSRAHSPDDPDWRILSAQGAVLDQLGRFDEARQYYASALKIAPEAPSVLSNLGLSYVLSKELPKAEETLRHALGRPDADPRVRQNLALVVGLQGRLAEAETIVKADRPPEEAAANVAYLKRLLARKATTHAETDSKPPARTEADSKPATAAERTD